MDNELDYFKEYSIIDSDLKHVQEMIKFYSMYDKGKISTQATNEIIEGLRVVEDNLKKWAKSLKIDAIMTDV